MWFAVDREWQTESVTITDLSDRRPPATNLDPKKLVFGKSFAPNMFLCEYRDGEWQDPRIEPVHNLALHPGALVLHYAQAIFEGMKAFRQADGSVALFRPEMNARRFQRSAERMCMPPVPEDMFLSAVSEITRVEEPYVVPEPGSLYLRPVQIGTEASIGVRSSHEFLFYVIALPSGGYFPEAHGGPGAIHVHISETVVRAARGGTGAVKAAANYAVTLKAISDARERECAQVLFLDSTPEQRVEEMGGMNILFNENGTLVTPPLNDTILPGVIRDTLLQIARDLDIPVREYAYSLRELLANLENGQIQEALACGTAATVTSIDSLRTDDGRVFRFNVPGPMADKLHRQLVAIQYGRTADKHGWIHSVVEAKSFA
jgi:branched-chain amino acid aminotransferase